MFFGHLFTRTCQPMSLATNIYIKRIHVVVIYFKTTTDIERIYDNIEVYIFIRDNHMY